MRRQFLKNLLLLVMFRQGLRHWKSAALLGRIGMLRTIVLGSCVSVQGTFERLLDNGKIQVRVGDRLFEGVPVTKKAA